jgi:hypothetical protein
MERKASAEMKSVKTWVVDAETKVVLSDDLDAEKRTDWLEDKIQVKAMPVGEVFVIYVRDRTEQDIKDADMRGGNLEDA